MALLSRLFVWRRVSDCALVLLGVGIPDSDRLRCRAMSEAPVRDHAHGTDAMHDLWRCLFSDSIGAEGRPLGPDEVHVVA